MAHDRQAVRAGVWLTSFEKRGLNEGSFNRQQVKLPTYTNLEADPRDLTYCLEIQRKRDAEFVGYVSACSHADRVQAGDVEIGFWVAERARNCGYATEAARGMISALSARASVKRVVAFVNERNVRSASVLRNLGMSLVGAAMLADNEHLEHFYASPSAKLPQDRQSRP